MFIDRSANAYHERELFCSEVGEKSAELFSKLDVFRTLPHEDATKLLGGVFRSRNLNDMNSTQIGIHYNPIRLLVYDFFADQNTYCVKFVSPSYLRKGVRVRCSFRTNPYVPHMNILYGFSYVESGLHKEVTIKGG